MSDWDQIRASFESLNTQVYVTPVVRKTTASPLESKMMGFVLAIVPAASLYVV
jgi:hypothetical protein